MLPANVDVVAANRWPIRIQQLSLFTAEMMRSGHCTDPVASENSDRPVQRLLGTHAESFTQIAASSWSAFARKILRR